jgi:hypothetical protein
MKGRLLQQLAAASALAGFGRGVQQRSFAADDLVFSPPVLIEAIPGKQLGADGFGAVSVDPAGDATLLHGPGYHTSYNSGKSWQVELPQGNKDWLPLANSWTGESSGFAVPGGNAVHNLGAIEACPPNGCWTDNHTKSSCNNGSLWVSERNVAWSAGCHSTPPPALSDAWLTTSPSVSFWEKNATDGKLWTRSECKNVVFRGLPLRLNKDWGMCDGFTQPTRLELADGSVLATFPMVFAGEEPPRNQYNHSLIVNHLPMSLVVFHSVDTFTFDFLAVAANYTQIPGMASGPWNPYNLTHSAYGPQENSMALLGDNKTIMIAFRPDTDSMCPGGPVPYKFYFQVYSTDGGKTFSQPTPIHGVGCVRPRMHRLPAGPLFMTGGRLCPHLVPSESDPGHGCLPQGGNGQGGIFVWANMDGMADAPSGTAKHGSEWRTYCLGAIHNKLVSDKRYLFVNCSKGAQCGSQTYNSIVPLGDHSVGVIYQNGYSSATASTWLMRVDLKPPEELPAQPAL